MMQTDQLFTRQKEMAGLGIYHFGARFYSPYINRFLSADTVVPNPSDPQAFNRYSYVLGNPLRYVDPSGNIPIDCYGTTYCGSTNSQLLPAPYVPPSTSGGGSLGGRTGGRSGGGGSTVNDPPLIVTNPNPPDNLGGGVGGKDNEPGNSLDPIITIGLDSVPGPAGLYSGLATGIDIFLLALSGYLELLSVAGVVIGYTSGAAFTGGTPVTGILGAIIGYSIVQMRLQPVMRAANYAGLFATGLGTIGDDKAGNSEVGLSVYTSESGLVVDLDAQLSSSVQTSWAITGLSFQGEAQLTETSGLLQLASVANDFGLLPSTPWGTVDFSGDFVLP